MKSTEDKIWGRTTIEKLFPDYSRHKLFICEGGYSSLHIHKDKVNRFVFESGCVIILTLVGNRFVEHELTDIFDVDVMIPHMFFALSDSIIYEEYYGNVDINDIVRFNSGGAIDVQNKNHNHMDNNIR